MREQEWKTFVTNRLEKESSNSERGIQLKNKACVNCFYATSLSIPPEKPLLLTGNRWDWADSTNLAGLWVCYTGPHWYQWCSRCGLNPPLALQHPPSWWTVQTLGQFEYNICTSMHVDIAYVVCPLNDHSLVSIPTVAQRLCCHVNHGWLDDNLEVVVFGSCPHSYFTVNSAWVQAGKWYITPASVYSNNNQPVKKTLPSVLLCAQCILQGVGLQNGLQHVDMVYWTKNSGMLKLDVWFTLAPGWLLIIGKQR